MSTATVATTVALRRLIEFYFSDAEMRTLYSRMAGIDGVSRGELRLGWVPLAHLATYSRVRKLSANINVLVGAIQGSDLLELSTDYTAVRRKGGVVPLDVVDGLLDFSSIYVCDLPADIPETALHAYFARFGHIESIAMFASTKAAVVQFGDEASAAEAVKVKHHYNGEQFTVQFKKKVPVSRKPPALVKALEAKTSKKRARGSDDAEGEAKKPSATPLTGAELKSGDACVTLGYTPGCLLEVKKLPAAASKSTLRNYFAAYGTIQSVTLDTTSRTAVLEYAEPLAAQVRAALFPDVFTVEPKDARFRSQFPESSVDVVQGESELAYHTARGKLAAAHAPQRKLMPGKGKKHAKLTRRTGRPLRPAERVLEAAETEAMHAKVLAGDEGMDMDEDVESAGKKRRVLSAEEQSAFDGLMAGLTGVAMS
ncbi:hypothetical protein H9P43_008483 [Blastocladiella emersonii ATCC 22665]|nr:hypothetical protein H9P43_008483 [Blastocladiella emersonii ATCC 22665]